MPSALVGRRLSILALGATSKISPHGGRCGGVVAIASVFTTVTADCKRHSAKTVLSNRPTATINFRY
ncbi:uncharacterized protein CLUP02_16201 [Colletotrichum lupini]|uniref:Uncharacterized protein n=1 Tax=Colletotrichum lupini TaxID=145971 RepID=A0A9Q8T9N4_9PEZI|nr:uncharacterized protein CLUP02_16201 [Colletotrichum lupini]UQC90671.1 hypothetical protein CLUP02_16201 [Colletotrichum lupini]